MLCARLSWLIGALQFNCLYRWHATTSQADEQWTQEVFSRLFPEKSVDKLTAADFGKVFSQAEQSNMTQWTFGK